MQDITTLLADAHRGDPAAAERAYRLLYGDLLRLARARLRRHAQLTLVDTGALVHEAWLRLHQAPLQPFEARGQFLAYAARAMQSILVDAARRRAAQVRGGDLQKVTLDDAALQLPAGTRLLAVHEAVEALSEVDARLADMVRMRFFAGLSEAEIGQAMGLNERTVRRDWEKARAFLLVALRD